MRYFKHRSYGFCVQLENTGEMRGFSDKLRKWQEQLNMAENLRLESVLLELPPPNLAVKKWWVPQWLFGVSLRRGWNLFYEAWPR